MNSGSGNRALLKLNFYNTALYLAYGQHLARSWRYTVATCGESRVRLLQEVCRLDIVESCSLLSGVYSDCVSGVKIDRVVGSGEMMGSTSVVKMTVRTDDDTWSVILVD